MRVLIILVAILAVTYCDDCPCPKETTTCCAVSAGVWGCCPLVNAVCCSDKQHCCPQNTTCDLEHGRCAPQSANSFMTYSAKMEKVIYLPKLGNFKSIADLYKCIMDIKPFVTDIEAVVADYKSGNYEALAKEVVTALHQGYDLGVACYNAIKGL